MSFYILTKRNSAGRSQQLPFSGWVNNVAWFFECILRPWVLAGNQGGRMCERTPRWEGGHPAGRGAAPDTSTEGGAAGRRLQGGRETPHGGGNVMLREASCGARSRAADRPGTAQPSGAALPLPEAGCHGRVIAAPAAHWPAQNRDWAGPFTTPVVSTWRKIAPETGGWAHKRRNPETGARRLRLTWR